MSQNDMTLANADGATFRADVNSALGALVSQSSGATEPSTTYAYMPWMDTSAGIMKMRNAANNAWINLWTVGASTVDLNIGGAGSIAGTLGVGGILTSTCTSSQWLTNASVTTSYSVINAQNTGGRTWLGVEASAGSTALTNSTAYATILTSVGNHPVQIGVNQTLIGSFASTGLDVTGVVTGTGNASFGSPEASTARLNVSAAGNSQAPARFYDTYASAGSNNLIDIFRNGGQVGTIATTLTNTSFNTSSDHRLKDIDGPVTDSGAFIDALKPVRGTWKLDGSRFVGFLAHEVAEVAPDTVIGVKDGMQIEQYEVEPAKVVTRIGQRAVVQTIVETRKAEVILDGEITEIEEAREKTVPVFASVDGKAEPVMEDYEYEETEPAVIGEREVPALQAMEYGSAEFIANIVAELQSLRRRAADQDARIAALEARP